MPLISEEYRSLNTKLHKTDGHYGIKGAMWGEIVLEMSEELKTQDILDYGCGKGTLAQNIPFKINQYDPAFETKSSPPRPADIVVCSDVLEHVERDSLDNVLDHLQDLTRKSIFINVATREAIRFLEDGRNAHLIVERIEWWLPKLWSRFKIVNIQNTEGEFIFTGEIK